MQVRGTSGPCLQAVQGQARAWVLSALSPLAPFMLPMGEDWETLDCLGGDPA